MEPTPAQPPAHAPVPVAALPAEPHVLQYEAGAPRRRRLENALFLPATLAGAAAPFLPLTRDVSHVVAMVRSLRPPVRELDVIIYLMACGLLTPLLLALYRLRVVLWGPATRRERWLGLAAAGVATAAVLFCLALMVRASTQPDERTATASGAAFMLAGALLFIRVARHGHDRDRAVFVAMLAPYVANSGMVLYMVLYGFPGRPQIGWYVTLAAAGAGLAEMILLAAATRGRPVG